MVGSKIFTIAAFSTLKPKNNLKRIKCHCEPFGVRLPRRKAPRNDKVLFTKSEGLTLIFIPDILLKSSSDEESHNQKGTPYDQKSRHLCFRLRVLLVGRIERSRPIPNAGPQ